MCSLNLRDLLSLNDLSGYQLTHGAVIKELRTDYKPSCLNYQQEAMERLGESSLLVDSLKTARTVLMHVEKRYFRVYSVLIMMTEPRRGLPLAFIGDERQKVPLTFESSTVHVVTGEELRKWRDQGITVRSQFAWASKHAQAPDVDHATYQQLLDKLQHRT